MSETTTRLKQVVTYLPPEKHEMLMAIKNANRRTSLSELGERAFDLAMETLKKEYAPSFNPPTRVPHGSRKARRSR